MEFLDQLEDEIISKDCKRQSCERCRRPQRVCWCPWLPEKRIEINGKLIILQHPGEEKRNLKTAPMLQNGLAPHSCVMFYGKKFGNGTKHEGLVGLLNQPGTFILYPGPNSISLDQIVQNRKSPSDPYNIVVLDGTWAQAKSMYFHSPVLHSLPQVSLPQPGPSLYVVRTQPSESCLSTVESAALAISAMEDRKEIMEQLVQPLKALCTFQLKFGAVEHHDKVTLLELGQYRKKIGKRTIKFLKQTCPTATINGKVKVES